MNRTLLTGANGFLGKYIENVFLNKKAELYTLGRFAGANYSLDIARDTPDFQVPFNSVIHAAGKAHMLPQTREENQSFFDINVKGTENILKALEKSGVPERFIFISSVSVYGLLNGNGINEQSALLANDPYGLSKIKAEELVKNWCDQHNVKCTILRLPLVVGTNPPGNLGNMISAIKKRYYFNIGNGKAKKSMVLAEDIANCIEAASAIGGTYNLTDGYHPDFKELSTCIAAQLGNAPVRNLSSVFALVMAKIGDLLGSKAPFSTAKYNKIISPLTFDDSKARENFGWNPRPVLEFFKIS